MFTLGELSNFPWATMVKFGHFCAENLQEWFCVKPTPSWTCHILTTKVFLSLLWPTCGGILPPLTDILTYSPRIFFPDSRHHLININLILLTLLCCIDVSFTSTWGSSLSYLSRCSRWLLPRRAPSCRHTGLPTWCIGSPSGSSHCPHRTHCSASPATGHWKG